MVSLRAADAPVWTTQDYGGERHLFTVETCRAFVILPPQGKRAETIPWVWYAPAIDGNPRACLDWLFRNLLEHGVAIAGVDVGETMANPSARAQFWRFYQEIRTRFPLDANACLLAQSRGGLNQYSFAAAHPLAVRCIVGIYPVLDLRSYPGLAKAAVAYGYDRAEDLAAHLPDLNPINLLAPIARARIPILHLHGDRDTLVPIGPNSAAAAENYRALGGEMTLIIVPGKGHQEVPEFFESTELLDFFLRHARTR